MNCCVKLMLFSFSSTDLSSVKGLMKYLPCQICASKWLLHIIYSLSIYIYISIYLYIYTLYISTIYIFFIYISISLYIHVSINIYQYTLVMELLQVYRWCYTPFTVSCLTLEAVLFLLFNKPQLYILKIVIKIKNTS